MTPYPLSFYSEDPSLYLRRIFDILFPQHEAAGNLASFTNREPGVLDGVTILREWLQDSTCDLDVKNPSAMLRALLMTSVLDIGHPPDSRKGNILKWVPRGLDGYRVDAEGNGQPLFLDVINALFRRAEGSIEQGIAFLQSVRYPSENLGAAIDSYPGMSSKQVSELICTPWLFSSRSLRPSWSAALVKVEWIELCYLVLSCSISHSVHDYRESIFLSSIYFNR